MAAMKVTSGGRVGDATKSKKKTADGVDGPGFADALKRSSSSDPAAAVSEAGSVGAVDSVFAVQEVADATDHASRGRAMAFGDDVLDRLDELRLAILAGVVPKERLQDLAQMLRQKREQTDDPRLDEIIGEIELRAEVEIAKLTRPL